MTIKKITTVTGEAAHCIDADPMNTSLAVGTEKGYINVFETIENEIIFKKFLDKQEGRILCLKYDPSGNFIAGGSIDAVRVWDVKTGHALHRMTTGRSETNKMTLVWCLAFTQDLTIISGDSRGKLTFWDGKIGAQIESYQSHRADILALCLSKDESTLYCAGTDPNIVSYVKVNVKNEYKWIRSIQRKVHDHDVRALALCKNRVYSGGIDSYLACSYYPPKTLLKYPHLMKNCIKVCPELRLILLKYSDHLEIWCLDEQKEKFEEEIPCGPENVKNLLCVKRSVRNEDGEVCNEKIICSSISNDGKWIVYSTNSIVRLLRFYYDDVKPKVVVKDLPKESGVCLEVTFSNNSLLFLALRAGGIQVLKLDESGAQEMQLIDTSRCECFLFI